MPRTREVRDPIHGLIELEPEEWGAIDTPRFQRLRSIRQLAMTHLAYPGATHSRFEHSLGVRHIAGRLISALNINAEDAAVVRCAALMHDVGHGPFSHVSEQVVDERSGVSDVHEAVSVAILKTDQRFHAELGEEVCTQAADLLALRGRRNYLRDIVSGPSDADKLDYLLRDSYFTGVKYGEYDLDKIINSALVIAPDTPQSQLGFDADGVWAVEGLLLARHHMHRQVYGHKTRLATDIMITRALHLGIDEGALPAEAYTVGVQGDRPVITEEFLELHAEQTDARVLQKLLEAGAGSNARDLAERLMERRLLRRTAHFPLHSLKREIGRFNYARLLDPEEMTRERVAEMEAEIARELGLQPHLVALYIDAKTNPTYRRPGTGVGEKDIMVQRQDEQPLLIHEESEILTEGTGEEHSFVYLYTPELPQQDSAKARDLLWNVIKPET